MMIDIFMPKLGLTMREGTVVQWMKAKGDAIEKGEVLLEITTEKITNSIEASVSGTLEQIIVPEGETAAVGAVVGLIRAAEGVGAQMETQETYLDENTLKVVEQEVPLSGVRKVIAERMEESLRKSPQASVTTRVDMSDLYEYKAELISQGKKVSDTGLLVKAVAAALALNPALNASVQDGKVLQYESINIGVAVAANGTLYVPVIHNTNEVTTVEVSQRIKAYADKAAAGKLSAQEMVGGTFTFSNMGMYDVDVMTPIINPPEAAILAIGTARKEVVVNSDDTTEIKPMAYLSLTIDHAATDGVPAAKFLQTLKKVLAEPDNYIKN